MSAKTRTWPCAVCQDPESDWLWNVRGLDGLCVFNPGVPQRQVAVQAWESLNQHFDWGRSRTGEDGSA